MRRRSLITLFSALAVSLFYVCGTGLIFQSVHTALLMCRYRSTLSVQDPASADLSFSFPVMRSPNGMFILTKTVGQDSFGLQISQGTKVIRHVLLTGNPLEFSWNPKNNTIAFLEDSHGSGRYCLFLWAFFDHSPVEQRIGEIENASFPLRWSPNGGALMFTDGNPMIEQLELSDFDGRKLSEPRRIARIIPQSDYGWSPDGRYVTYVSLDSKPLLTVRELAAETKHDAHIDLDGGEVHDLTWSKDGKSLIMAYRGRADQDFNLGSWILQSNVLTECPSYGADVIQPQGTRTGDIIAILRSHATDHAVLIRDCIASSISFGLRRDVKLVQMGYSGSGFDRYDVLARDSQNPPSLYALEAGNGWAFSLVRGSARLGKSPDQQTFSQPYEQVVIVDGTPISTWVWKPQSDTPPSGIIVWIHGGPHLYESAEWSPMYEEMIRRGFIVVAPNYSGSTTFGKNFEKQGSLEGRAREVLYLADWSKHQWPKAASNMVIGGSSYGTSIMVAALRTNQNICGRVVFSSSVLPSQHETQLNFNGEIVVLHGDSDPISPLFSTLWKFASLLKKRPLFDSNFRLLVFRGEGHGFNRLRSQLALADIATIFKKRSDSEVRSTIR